MLLSNEIEEYDQRQLKVMQQRLEFCDSKTVSQDVSADLIGLSNLLNKVCFEWKERFLRLCYRLDYIYDIARYEKRYKLSLSDQNESKKIVEELKAMISPLITEDSRPN